MTLNAVLEDITLEGELRNGRHWGHITDAEGRVGWSARLQGYDERRQRFVPGAYVENVALQCPDSERKIQLMLRVTQYLALCIDKGSL
jgi:hypothetical protein